MISPIKIIGSNVFLTREALNNDAEFIDKAKRYHFDLFSGERFNMWHYPGTANEISNVLLAMQKDNDSARIKFPALFNFHPIEQSYSDQLVTYTFNLAFVAPTKSEWTTEQREKFVFEPILRPMYSEFFNQLVKSAKYFNLDFGFIPHNMYEVYTTGNNQDELIKGRYSDYIDAIEVHNLRLSVKKLCDKDIKKIEEQNLLVTN